MRGRRSRRFRSSLTRGNRAVADSGARQECQRLGRSDSPFGEENAPRRRQSRWARRSESRCREPPDSPHRNRAFVPAYRIGNQRGAGARSECVERQKSVGRTLYRRSWGVARRATDWRPSRKETAASLTRAAAGRRRNGAQASSGIIYVTTREADLRATGDERIQQAPRSPRHDGRRPGPLGGVPLPERRRVVLAEQVKRAA